MKAGYPTAGERIGQDISGSTVTMFDQAAWSSLSD